MSPFLTIRLQGSQMERLTKSRIRPAHGRQAVRIDQRDLYRVKRGMEGGPSGLFSENFLVLNHRVHRRGRWSLLSGRDDEERGRAGQSQGGEFERLSYARGC